MKKAFLAAVITISMCYLSCKKTQDSPGEIYGTWRLTETMFDPGDGSGKYTKVKGDAKYLTVNRSGTIEGEALPDVVKVKVLDSARLQATYKNYDQPITLRYQVDANALTINPPCIEGCGFRFARK